jgi:hypothetical protein
VAVVAVPGVVGEELGEREGQVQALGDVLGRTAMAGEDHRGVQDRTGLII